MTNAYEPELGAAVRRMEAARRTIERAITGTDLSATYAELDEAVRDYEAAVPKWREQQTPR